MVESADGTVEVLEDVVLSDADGDVLEVVGVEDVGEVEVLEAESTGEGDA